MNAESIPISFHQTLILRHQQPMTNKPSCGYAVLMPTLTKLYHPPALAQAPAEKIVLQPTVTPACGTSPIYYMPISNWPVNQ